MSTFDNVLNKLDDNENNWVSHKRLVVVNKFYDKFTNERIDLSHLNVIVENGKVYLITYLNIEGEFTKEWLSSIRVCKVKEFKTERVWKKYNRLNKG